MKQTSIEELKKKFRVANVPDKGKCIIIPVDKFEPEWDQLILDAGLESHAGEDVVYVYLKDEEAPPLTATAAPRFTQAGSRGRGAIRGNQWTEDEDKLLIELWNQKPRLKRDDVAKKFMKIYPQRTLGAVENRLARLRKKGRIKPRFQKKGTPAPFPPSTGAAEAYGQVLDDIIRVLEKHSKLLDKLECQMLMQVLELKQQKGELTIPPNLRVHYANALLEDDVKFRDVFRNKVKQLLEASQ